MANTFAAASVRIAAARDHEAALKFSRNVSFPAETEAVG